MKGSKFSDCLIDVIISQLELRSNDPWPDELWPAANTVLTSIVNELKDMKKELVIEACHDYIQAKQKTSKSI